MRKYHPRIGIHHNPGKIITILVKYTITLSNTQGEYDSDKMV